MITIFIYGIDPYLLRNLSKELTPKLADIYEVKREEINFFAPEGLFVHEGIEQNTWNGVITVLAPLKVKILEQQVYRVIEEYIKDLLLHFEAIFNYYSTDNYHIYNNADFPRYLNEENKEVEDEYEVDEIEEDELFQENAFAEFEESIKKLKD